MKTAGIIVFVTFLVFLFLKWKSKHTNPLKYKYLFRKVIKSKSQRMEIIPVMQGRVYRPQYYYLPKRNQYLVYSSLDESGPFKFHVIGAGRKGQTYNLLDAHGNLVTSIDEELPFSIQSGAFYGSEYYIPWLETGTTTPVKYDTILNQDLKFDQKSFNLKMAALYDQADYVEYVYLRYFQSEKYESGAFFKIKGKTTLLLSGIRNAMLSEEFVDNPLTNERISIYYPKVRNVTDFAASKPMIESQVLETKNANPYVHKKSVFKKPIKIKGFKDVTSNGWVGMMKLYGLPIFMPAGSYGTALVSLHTNKEVFKLRIPDVEKRSYLPNYNLGLRTFKLPETYKTTLPTLTFLESTQNSGQNRVGGGVYVIRPVQHNSLISDLPAGMEEAYFNSLPLYLQMALMHPKETTDLIIAGDGFTEWLPEINLLSNLKKLCFKSAMKEIPDDIQHLKHLEELDFRHNEIVKISDKIAALKSLKRIDLSSNNLSELPKSVLRLPNLEILELGFNPITRLPDNFNSLENLRYLSIIQTAIKQLPESLIGMDKLYIRDNDHLSPHLPAPYQHLFQFEKFSTYEKSH